MNGLKSGCGYTSEHEKLLIRFLVGKGYLLHIDHSTPPNYLSSCGLSRSATLCCSSDWPQTLGCSPAHPSLKTLPCHDPYLCPCRNSWRWNRVHSSYCWNWTHPWWGHQYNPSLHSPVQRGGSWNPEWAQRSSSLQLSRPSFGPFYDDHILQ